MTRNLVFTVENLCFSQTNRGKGGRTYVEYSRRWSRFVPWRPPAHSPKGRIMSGRALRLMGLGRVATAGAGFLSLAAMINSGFAHADGEDIGLVMGGSGLPIPGPDYVASADLHYLEHIYPGDITSFFGATTGNPFGEGLFTPEGLYPLTGVHTLPLNYPSGGELGLPTNA